MRGNGYKPTRMAKLQNLTIPGAGEDAEQIDPLYVAGGNTKW